MLHRSDVRFRVSHAEATPDRLAVRDSLAARLGKSADEVVIRRLDTKFGMRETLGEAKVYQGADVARDVEQPYMLARNKIGVAAGGAGAEVETEEAAADEGEADEPAEPEAEDEATDEPADEAEADDDEATDDEAEEEA